MRILNKIKRLSFLLVLTITLVHCKKKETTDDTTSQEKNIVPQNFVVDIPSSISTTASYKLNKGDTISGKDIYQNMRTFIFIGEHAAHIVNDIMGAIRKHNINKPMTLDFVSDDDKRTKNLVVTENQIYDGITYQFKLEITDKVDSATAMTIYWNQSPVQGVAVMNPYEIDHNNDLTLKEVRYKIEYSEAHQNYDKTMTVSISGLPTNPDDLGAIDNLKLFAAKKGDLVTVYGNSNHPRLHELFQDSVNTKGMSYAFVGKGDETQDIGIVELAIPPSTKSTNNDILNTDAVKTVLMDFLKKAFPNAKEEDLNKILVDAEAPGYFDNTGFVSAQTAPNNGKNYTQINDLTGLLPYIPVEIKDLTINF